MAALRYRDEHNKVGYLQKPKGSDDYHQVLDFLRASHIRTTYATFGCYAHKPEQSYEHGQSQTLIMLLIHKSKRLLMLPFTSTNMEKYTFRRLYPCLSTRSTQAPLQSNSGGIEDLSTLTALSSVVSSLVQKVKTLETELKDHKQLFKDVVGKLVQKFKALDVQLKTRKRKVVVSDSDQEEGGEPDVDALIKLAKAAVTIESTIPSGGADIPADVSPSADVPTSTTVPSGVSAGISADVPSGVAPTGPSTVSPGSTTVPTSSSIPAAEPIPARSGTTTATPSSPVRDARKGKGVAVEEPTPTQDKTFKQMEEERLGWEAAQRLQAQELADLEKQRAESLMKDANLARQMSQDFEMTEDQRKRQQEVLASAANYSDAAWDIILARLQANPGLSSTIFGVDFTDDDFAAKMVALVNSRRKELAEQRAQERRDRPMTPAQLRQYMRTYVKNQGPAVYTTGWTMAQVRKLSPEQLQEEFDKIQRAVAFIRGLKRDGSPMTTAFSKKLKTGDVEVDVEAPSHGVPQEVEVETPSQDVSREKVDASSRSQNIPATQVEVPSQEATVEDVEVPSNIASKAQQTSSTLKKVGTKKKLLGRKGVHPSQSTIPIEEGDPDAEHKLCIKYASDEDSAFDCDTPVHLYDVVDWELLPTGLGSINAIYRLDNSRKYFTSLQEILYLVTRADLMTIYGRVITFYQDKKAEGVGLVLWGDLKILMDSPEVNDGSDFWKNQHTWSIRNWKLYSFSGVHVLETVSGLVIHMFVDKKYPLAINLIERMLDHQLEICHGPVGNELTTAVQLIAFLKKQISDSNRPKVHEWVINSPCYHNKELASPEQTATAEVVPKSVAGSSFPAASSTLLPFDVQICAEVSCVQVKTQADWMLLYVVPTGRVVVPTGRYVVPAGKVIIIVSPGRLSLVPTGRILSPVYSNPLFDLDKEIISSEFNPIHNEDLDSTSKNDRFDTKSYLPESLLNHDTLIVSSPRNDPLHHEFTGEIITTPPRIAREHEEYLSCMWLLCGNSSSQPPENFHASPNTNIESLPTSPIPVEDSDSLREKIDIFSGPDDLIPPEIERDDYDSENDDSFENIEYVEASPSDLELVSLEEVNDIDQEKEEFSLKDVLQVQDVILREKLLNINRLIAKIEYLNDNPTFDHVLKFPSSFPIPVTDSDSFFEESDASFSHLDNSLPEFETFSDHTEETRSGSTTTHNSLSEYDSFLFEIEPDQGGLTSIVISDNSNDHLLEIPQFESFHFDPSFPRPPPEPPDVEICLNFEADAPMINNFDELNEDEYFDQREGEIDFSQNVEDDDSFKFIIRIFLPFLTYPEDSPLFLSTGSEDTVFDPGITAFHFSLKSAAFEESMEVCSSKTFSKDE
ncbi:hypothetical protein Tco_0268372 [Tanacetum coccineum]